MPLGVELPVGVCKKMSYRSQAARRERFHVSLAVFWPKLLPAFVFFLRSPGCGCAIGVLVVHTAGRMPQKWDGEGKPELLQTQLGKGH